MKRTGTHHTGTGSSTWSIVSSPTTREPLSKASSTSDQPSARLRRADEVVVDERRAVVRAHLAQHHEALVAGPDSSTLAMRSMSENDEVGEERPRGDESLEVVDRGLVEPSSLRGELGEGRH